MALKELQHAVVATVQMQNIDASVGERGGGVVTVHPKNGSQTIGDRRMFRELFA